MVRLFRLAGEQTGTGRDIRPVFESRNIVCSGLGKLCFPLREIFSVTQNNLPARGLKTPPKSSFLPGTRVPRPIFKRSTGPRHFHSKLAPQNLVFAHSRTQKRGKSCRICPGKRLDPIQFFENKIPDLQFSFGSSERF